MKKAFKILFWLSIILSAINLIFIPYSFWHYSIFPRWFAIPEIYGMLVYIGLLILFASYFILVPTLIMAIKKTKPYFAQGVLAIIAACLSFISLFYHWGCLTDIYKEYPAGLEVKGELTVAWISQIIHATSVISILVFLLKIRKQQLAHEKTNSLFGEQLFVIVHVVGTVCGFAGLFMTALLHIKQVNPVGYKWAILPIIFFFTMPYVFVLATWAIQTFYGNSTGLTDEKQKSDIYKSGTISLIINIFFIFLLYLVNFNNLQGSISILWLPFFLFGALLFFSITALYNYKRA